VRHRFPQKRFLCQERTSCGSLQIVKRQARAAVVYMTGTGNTADAAAAIAAELTRDGWTVKAAELAAGVPLPTAAHSPGNLLVLCFPVLGFGMPALVRRQLKGLRGGGRPAAVFATWGGEGGAALWQARLFLRLRGFRIVASSGAAYPFQWTQVVPPQSGEEAALLMKTGSRDARDFGRLIAAHLRAGTRVPAAGGLARRLARAAGVLLGLPVAWTFSSIGRHGLAAMNAADARCKGCGSCVRMCPANAIVMAGPSDERRPRWRAGCEGCNRCINLCPRSAVQVSPVRAGIHLLLNTAVIVAVVMALNRASSAAAGFGLPGILHFLAYAALLIVLVVVGSRVQFAALEPALFAVEGIPAVRGLIARSWTAHFPRYRHPGFRPVRRQTAD
jgi:ferredoxin